MKIPIYKVGTYMRSERQFIEISESKIKLDDIIPFLGKNHNLKFRCFNSQIMIFQNNKEEVIKIDMDDIKPLLTLYIGA